MEETREARLERRLLVRGMSQSLSPTVRQQHNHRPEDSIAEEFRRFKESTEAKMEAMCKRQDGDLKGKEQGEGVASDGYTLVNPEILPKLSRVASRRKMDHPQRSVVLGAWASGPP